MKQPWFLLKHVPKIGPHCFKGLDIMCMAFGVSSYDQWQGYEHRAVLGPVGRYDHSGNTMITVQCTMIGTFISGLPLVAQGPWVRYEATGY